MLPEPTGVLLRRYARERRCADLDELVLRFQPLARGLARRYYLPSVSSEDLEQAAYLGLIAALQRFEPELGNAFSTYAVPTILGEIRRHCREAAWPAHVPRAVKERVREVRRQADTLELRLRRAPTVAEIAQRLACDEDAVVDALIAASTRDRVSLDAPAREGGNEPVAATVGAVDPGYELSEMRLDIERAIPRLDGQERRVLRLRFAEERSFREIGAELAVPPARAARIARRSLAHLRMLTCECTAVAAG